MRQFDRLLILISRRRNIFAAQSAMLLKMAAGSVMSEEGGEAFEIYIRELLDLESKSWTTEELRGMGFG